MHIKTRLNRIIEMMRKMEMKRIFFIHFNEAELKEKIKPLRESGYKVDYHFSTETVADFRDDLPDVLVMPRLSARPTGPWP